MLAAADTPVEMAQQMRAPLVEGVPFVPIKMEKKNWVGTMPESALFDILANKSAYKLNFLPSR